MHTKKMECPVCYECDARCEFVCGHSFCYQCVKTWYQKGSHTCPMCRASICFRGLLGARRVWECEKRAYEHEDILASVVEELFDELEVCEGYEYVVGMLSLVHDRYRRVIEEYPTIDGATLEYVLLSLSVDIGGRQVECEWDEFASYTRYLMVPNTSYGVKIRISPSVGKL